MYRSMLYYLVFVWSGAVFLSILKILPYNPQDIIWQTLYLLVVCYLSNFLFARLFKAKSNPESQFITGFILSLLIGPLGLGPNLLFLSLAAVAAMASKYLISLGRRHILNPAASGVLVTALLVGNSASWWVGNLWLNLFVVLGGVVMIHKIRKFHLILSFLITYALLILATSNFAGITTIFYSPILFFVFVMLVEPLTSPQVMRLRIYYGIFIAVVLAFYQKFLNVPYTLELSLVTGNIFGRIINPNFLLALNLTQRENLGPGVIGFWFEPLKRFGFASGQFLEYTLPHSRPDSRGFRRYFTIASSPSENKLLLATRFSEQGSSFKEALKNLELGTEIKASGPAGEYVLPKDPARKLVFIAGGIGITPFRSMIKYLVDTGQKRDIVLMYSCKTAQDVIFKNVFDDVEKTSGLRTVYVANDEKGFINEEMIQKEIPDFQERFFYVSGPEPMVQAFEKMLAKMKIPKKQIKRDYFPGYTTVN